MAKPLAASGFVAGLVLYPPYPLVVYSLTAFIIGSWDAMAWEQAERFGMVFFGATFFPIYAGIVEVAEWRKSLAQVIEDWAKDQPHDN